MSTNRRILIESEVEYRASLAPILKPLRNPPVPINPPSRPGTSDGKTTPFMRNPSYVDHLLQDNEESNEKKENISRPSTSSSTLKSNNLQVITTDMNNKSSSQSPSRSLSPSHSSSPYPNSNSPQFNTNSSFNPLIDNNLPPIKINLNTNTKLHPQLIASNSNSPITNSSSNNSPKDRKNSSPPHNSNSSCASSNSTTGKSLPPPLKLNTNNPLFNLGLMDLPTPTSQRIRVKEKELKNNLLNSLIKNREKIEKLSLPPTFQSSRSIKMNKYLKKSMESMASIQEQYLEAEAVASAPTTAPNSSYYEGRADDERGVGSSQESSEEILLPHEIETFSPREQFVYNKNHPLFNRSNSALNFRAMLERQNSRINYNIEKSKENELQSTKSFMKAINGVKKDIKNFKKREMNKIKGINKKELNRKSSSSSSSPAIGLASKDNDDNSVGSQLSKKILESQSQNDLNKVIKIDGKFDLNFKEIEGKGKDKSKLRGKTRERERERSRSKERKEENEKEHSSAQPWDNRFIHLNLLSKPFNKNASALVEPRKPPQQNLKSLLDDSVDNDDSNSTDQFLLNFVSNPFQIPPPHVSNFPYSQADMEADDLITEENMATINKNINGNNNTFRSSFLSKSLKKQFNNEVSSPTSNSPPLNHNELEEDENSPWNSESQIAARFLLTNWPGGVPCLKNYFNCLNSIYYDVNLHGQHFPYIISNPFNIQEFQGKDKKNQLNGSNLLRNQLKEWLSSRIVTPAVHIALNYIAILLNIEETIKEERKKYEIVDRISKKSEKTEKESSKEYEDLKKKKKILNKLTNNKNNTNYSWNVIKNFLLSYKIENLLNFILNLTPFDIPIHLLYSSSCFLIKKRNFIIKKKKNFLLKHVLKNSFRPVSSSGASIVSSSSSVSSISTLNPKPTDGSYFQGYLETFYCNCHLNHVNNERDEIRLRCDSLESNTSITNPNTSPSSSSSTSTPPKAPLCQGDCIMKPLGDPLLLYTLKNNEGEYENDKDKDKDNLEKFCNSFKDIDIDPIFSSSKNLPYINYRYVSTKLLVWVILFNTIGSIRCAIEKKRLLELYDEEVKLYYQNMNFYESEEEGVEETEGGRDDELHYYNDTEEHNEEKETVEEETQNLSILTRVRVNYNNNGKYYDGIITNVFDDNFYSIKYDDGDFQERVSIDLIQIIDTQKIEALENADIQLSEKVEDSSQQIEISKIHNSIAFESNDINQINISEKKNIPVDPVEQNIKLEINNNEEMLLIVEQHLNNENQESESIQKTSIEPKVELDNEQPNKSNTYPTISVESVVTKIEPNNESIENKIEQEVKSSPLKKNIKENEDEDEDNYEDEFEYESEVEVEIKVEKPSEISNGEVNPQELEKEQDKAVDLATLPQETEKINSVKQEDDEEQYEDEFDE